MIDLAVKHIASQLNQFLKQVLPISEDIVVVSNLAGSDGSAGAQVNNKVVLFITAIERDTVPVRAGDSGSGRMLAAGAPLFLNLYVMVAANFSDRNYPEALKFISAAIGFFQAHPVFDRISTPDLDPRIERLVLDIENLKPQEASNIWGMLGAKYVPSVLYRVRMVALDGAAILGRQTSIADPSVAISRPPER